MRRKRGKGREVKVMKVKVMKVMRIIKKEYKKGV